MDLYRNKSLISKILSNFELCSDGIYGDVSDYGDQHQEKILRQSVANKKYDNYLIEISKHHSIPVMDNEVENFIKLMPINSVILDIGGCWGWHWRYVISDRPDLTIVIVDLIRENLFHTHYVLKDGISNGNIILVHGNACSLNFSNDVFDGVWSVQTTQHIPNYKNVCTEIHRVLKPNGYYWDYSLNNAFLVRYLFQIFGKKYHLDGVVPNNFYLRRINQDVFSILNQVFGDIYNLRYSELLFTPEIKFPIGGREKSIIGFIDSKLSGKGILRKSIARQCSIHVKKL